VDRTFCGNEPKTRTVSQGVLAEQTQRAEVTD